MSSEHRQLKRWHLIYYLRVFDNQTGEVIGNLVDVTTEGLMLVSDKEITGDKDYVLKMEYPARENRAKGEVILNAHKLWSKVDINSIFYDTGFRLINPSPQAIAVIRDLIEELAF